MAEALRVADALIGAVAIAVAVPSFFASVLHLTRQLEVAPWQRWMHTTGTRIFVVATAAGSVIDSLQGEFGRAIAAIICCLILATFKCQPCHHDDGPGGGRRTRLAALLAWLQWRRQGVALPIPA